MIDCCNALQGNPNPWIAEFDPNVEPLCRNKGNMIETLHAEVPTNHWKIKLKLNHWFITNLSILLVLKTAYEANIRTASSIVA